MKDHYEGLQHFEYDIDGVCCKHIAFDAYLEDFEENGKHWCIKDITFTRGCPGNLSMLARLFNYHTIEWVKEMCLNHKCGNRPTSCMAEFAKCLEKVEEEVSHVSY